MCALPEREIYSINKQNDAWVVVVEEEEEGAYDDVWSVNYDQHWKIIKVLWVLYVCAADGLRLIKINKGGRDLNQVTAAVTT